MIAWLGIKFLVHAFPKIFSGISLPYASYLFCSGELWEQLTEEQGNFLKIIKIYNKSPHSKAFQNNIQYTSVASESIIVAYHMIMKYITMSQGVKKNVIYKNAG